MSKKANWVQTLIFLAFIAAFFILNIALPDKDFSQQENRSLQTAPKFTFSDLFSGEFTVAYEDYVTDQFAFRDSWTALKARSELVVGNVFSVEPGIYLEGRYGVRIEDVLAIRESGVVNFTKSPKELIVI